MGRTAKNKDLNSSVDGFNKKRLEEAEQATQELVRMNTETSDNAHALAAQLGYAGILTVGAVEDEIRMYQGRAAEASFEMGKRLLILKELTPHGEFQQRVDLMGINYRFAARVMQTARRFSKVSTPHLLKAASTQSKLLELLVLDDDEIEALEAGETVRNLHVDKIDTMSVRELKAALRARDELLASKERQITAKNTKLDELDAQLNSKPVPQRDASGNVIHAADPEEAAAELREEITQEAANIGAAIRGTLRPLIKELSKHGEDNDQLHEDFIVGQLCQIEADISMLRGQFNLKEKPDGDERPDFLKPEVVEKARKETARLVAAREKRIQGGGHA